MMHTGPVAVIAASFAWGLLAQATPSQSPIETYGPMGLAVAAIGWLVKQLTDERKYSHELTERYQSKMEELVGKSVEAHHNNELATERNTDALERLSEKIDQIGR